MILQNGTSLSLLLAQQFFYEDEKRKLLVHVTAASANECSFNNGDRIGSFRNNSKGYKRRMLQQQ